MTTALTFNSTTNMIQTTTALPNPYATAGTGNMNQTTTAALPNPYAPVGNGYQDSSQTSDLSNVSSNNTEISEVLGAYKTVIAKKKSDFDGQELVQLKYAVYSVVWPKLKFLTPRIMKSMTSTPMYNNMMKTMGKTGLSEASQTRYWLSIEGIIETLFKDIRNERNGTLKKNVLQGKVFSYSFLDDKL